MTNFVKYTCAYVSGLIAALSALVALGALAVMISYIGYCSLLRLSGTEVEINLRVGSNGLGIFIFFAMIFAAAAVPYCIILHKYYVKDTFIPLRKYAL